MSVNDLAAEELTPAELLNEFDVVNIAAPMVRYSKLPFRELVSMYETHITHTPMILAQEFSRSARARDSDFSTNSTERGTFYMPSPSSSSSTLDSYTDIIESRPRSPRQRKIKGRLVAQFAANDATQLADAVALIAPFVDGIDINAGCPQGWAFKEGIGCALLRKPETVRELVRGVKARVGESFSVSVKIRVDDDLSRTNTLVTTAISAGADYITIHGRTRHQSSTSHPVNLEAIAFAVDCAKGAVPCVANGDVFTLAEAQHTREVCGVKGVMAARGLLSNPALFSGYDKTPLAAIDHFVRISANTGLIFPLFHRHVSYMLESHLLKKRDRTYFNVLPSHAAVYDYWDEFKADGLMAKEESSVVKEFITS